MQTRFPLKLIRYVSVVTTDGVNSEFYVELFDGELVKVYVETISPRLVEKFDSLRDQLYMFGHFNMKNKSMNVRLEEMSRIANEIDMLSQYIDPIKEVVTEVPSGTFDLFKDF